MTRHGSSQILKRRSAVREPKKRVYVFCEGTKTEPEYLNDVSRLSQSAVVKLEIMPHVATSPWEIVEAAVVKMKEIEGTRRRNGGLAQGDEVWACFDVDEHQKVKEACQRAYDTGVKVALSNPCIEVWFLLHFQDQTAYIHRREALSGLKRHWATYEKSIDSIDALAGGFSAATSRSQSLIVKHDNDGTLLPDNNPSSNMFLLVQSLECVY